MLHLSSRNGPRELKEAICEGRFPMVNMGNNAEISDGVQIIHGVFMLANIRRKWYNILMQFKVPQDVLRADKIVGFLTLRQLIIVALGGGVSYSLYIILSKQYVLEIWLPPVVFIAVITLAFAFVKFHDIVFEKLVLVFIEYKFRPRARTWQKMRGDIVLSVLQNPLGIQKEPEQKAEKMTARDRRKKLEAITKLVDTHGKKVISGKEPLAPKT